jgi:O-antigen/teichoic acid export membrane protein
MGDNLKQKTLSAFTWTTIDRFGQQAVQLVIGIILARLLSPDDYGLMGMVMIFAALSYVLVESGFGQALIRKTEADETDFNSVFYFNVGISLVLYTVLFFLSPTIANFFKQPELVWVNRITFLAIIFNAFYLVPLMQLLKVLDYKTIAKVNIISIALSGSLGITIAFLHYGVWALVIQQVSYHFFRMIFFYLFVRWKPKLIFSFRVIRSFWKFSIHLLNTSVLNIIFNYLFVIILGKFYKKSEVGYYTQGNKLSETFNFTFQSILLGSTFSLFSQIQHDDNRFRRIFGELSNKISIITFPITLCLIAAGKPLIEIAWSAKYLPSVPYFQLLCVASLFLPLYTLNISALNARGQSRTTFRIEMIKKIFILIAIFTTFSQGIIPMLWGYAAANIAAYFLSMFYIKTELKQDLKQQILAFSKSLGWGIILNILVASLSLLIKQSYFLLPVQIILAAAFYLLIIRFFYRELYEKGMVFLNQNLPKLGNIFSKSKIR